MANRRRQAVTVTLPADVLISLRELAERECRALSRELEVAAVRHLDLAQSGGESK